MIRICVLLIFVLTATAGYAQEGEEADSLTKKEGPAYPQLGKPTRAALLSAALPGAGQIYNKKAWQLKVPVIYMGGAVLGYLVIDTHAEYQGFREAYKSRIDNNPNTVESPFYANFSDDGLIRNRDNFRRDRDFYIILSAFWYLLNVAEAATTAHLNEFNVNEDLSLRIKPYQERVGAGGTGQLFAGVSVCIPLR